MDFIKRLGDAWRVLTGGNVYPTIEVSDEDVYRARYEDQMKSEIEFLRSLVSPKEQIISGDPTGISEIIGLHDKSENKHESTKVHQPYMPFSTLRNVLETKLKLKAEENRRRENENTEPVE